MTISLVTAGACALINLWLAFRIGRIRRAHGIYVGDGGNDVLARRMRSQANFVEYAPFVLILIALIEYVSGSSVLLWIAAAAFIAARIAHPFGMDGWIPGRMAGTLVTFLLLLALGLYAVSLPFTHGNPIPADGVTSPPPSA
ncbi:MAPEG family protein [Stakelama sp. CBK3Z-3]|uniref:MAPEG family protein n=1 Tax=Stakelama flava TaxID=2860338 RepID=A0ABS6XP10_9SPHN|nr:MAPEG family protein [Stakelama flava]MBW4331949.1 MAPEG family protein [Stakelama flava]